VPRLSAEERRRLADIERHLILDHDRIVSGLAAPPNRVGQPLGRAWTTQRRGIPAGLLVSWAALVLLFSALLSGVLALAVAVAAIPVCTVLVAACRLRRRHHPRSRGASGSGPVS
jgi:Protein of unknown function (DUF3040)